MSNKEKERAYQRAYYLANREKILKRQRELNVLPEKAAELAVRSRAHYLANREKILERQREYTRANPDVALRKVLAWQKRHPEKLKAQSALTVALRSGRLVKPEICPKCGGSGRIEGHHPDYSKPLDVEFLCRPCHLNEHRK